MKEGNGAHRQRQGTHLTVKGLEQHAFKPCGQIGFLILWAGFLRAPTPALQLAGEGGIGVQVHSSKQHWFHIREGSDDIGKARCLRGAKREIVGLRLTDAALQRPHTVSPECCRFEGTARWAAADLGTNTKTVCHFVHE